MSDKKNLKIISNDISLHSKFVETGFFIDVTIDASLEIADKADILIVSDSLVNFNSFIEFYQNNSEKYQKVFFIASSYSGDKLNVIKSILFAKGVVVIPPKYTINQIVEHVCVEIGEKLLKNKNVFAFFGADTKVGTSITVQAIAEMLAQNTRSTICLLNLSGNPGADYIGSNDVHCIDNIKVKILNNILSLSEFKDACFRKDNLYILQTVRNIEELRHYTNIYIEYLILLASSSFDIVLIDAGSDPDNGMYIGSLRATSKRYLVTTQQDNSLRYFQLVIDQVYSQLDFKTKDFFVVVNKFINSPELYTSSKLAEIYNSTLIGELPYLEYGWQAERDKCSLLKYDDMGYNESITELAKILALQLNIDFIETNKKKKGFLKRLLA